MRYGAYWAAFFGCLTFICSTTIAGGPPAAAATMVGKQWVKLDQFAKAEFCDIATGPNGMLNAIYTERPAVSQPAYVYYRASTDDGRTWSQPANLSDDQSGRDASWARVLVDGRGRTYVLWKYVKHGDFMNGPGGNHGGQLCLRAAEGTWSQIIPLGDANVPTFSWFAALDAAGSVHVVWSQPSAETLANKPVVDANYANQVRHTILEGAAPGTPADLIVPNPIMTKQQADHLRAAGQSVKYDETVPQRTGLCDLSGYVDARGAVHFVAERADPADGSSGPQIVIFDGTRLGRPVHVFPKNKSFNTFQNPPALLPDASGRPHLILAPEQSEKPCVRDYVVNGDRPLDAHVDVIAPTTGPGKLTNWQAHPLPGGRILVTAALSEKGGYDPDDLRLITSVMTPDGKWSSGATVALARPTKEGFDKQTTPVDTLGAVYMYKPVYAAATFAGDGHACLLMVNNEDTTIGVSSTGVTTGGTVVKSIGGLRTDNPSVYFVKF